MVSPLEIVQPGQTRTRRKRSPSFPLAGTMALGGIYPIFATPVLPGETLNEAEMKWRVLSMPVRHPFVGAWLETWLCYVKLTDIDPVLGEMFITDSASSTAFLAPSDRPHYFTKGGKIDYIKLAVDRVVQAYFRDEEEPDWATHLVDTDIHQVKRLDMSWAQNLMFKPAMMDMADMPSSLPAEGTLTPLEIMKLAGMSEVTYEKYLMQYGVSAKAANAAANLPEMLRYTREWTVPTNTLDPATGAPSSAWAWGGTLKAEKAKRFDEPGFLIWMAAIRPKMFDGTVSSSLISALWGFSDFFPVYNLDDPAAGIKELDDGFVTNNSTGPVPLIYDHRDLLSHGEQFVNDWAGPYDLPKATGRSIADGAEYPTVRGHYPQPSDFTACFSDTENATRQRCFYEGIASMTITGHVVDTTR